MIGSLILILAAWTLATHLEGLRPPQGIFWTKHNRMTGMQCWLLPDDRNLVHQIILSYFRPNQGVKGSKPRGSHENIFVTKGTSPKSGHKTKVEKKHQQYLSKVLHRVNCREDAAYQRTYSANDTTLNRLKSALVGLGDFTFTFFGKWKIFILLLN